MRASLSSIRTRDQRSFSLKPNAKSFIDVKSCRDWDNARVSDIEPRFTCQACGTKGAVVRPTRSSPI